MDNYAFSTIGLERRFLNAVLILIIIVLLPYLDGCLTGFQTATTSTGEQYCYKKKGPETFFDKFKDCNGNLFSYKMLGDLSLPTSGDLIWTEYKSLDPGSVFVDWSYTNSTGELLKTTFEVYREGAVDLSKKLCVVTMPGSNFTMKSCDDHHYRYCVLKPGSDIHDVEDVTLTVTVTENSSKDIQLFVNYATPRGTDGRKLVEANIMCFTDSLTFNPSGTVVNSDSKEREVDVYNVSPRSNGYYWCTHSDPNFKKSDSNRALYISDLTDVMDLYAVKIKNEINYTLVGMTALESNWTLQIKEYISYSMEYKPNGTEVYDNTTIIKFKAHTFNHTPDVDPADRELEFKAVKRPYLDAMTIIFHVEVADNISVKPGQWDHMFLEYMKPVYYCNKEKNFKLGDNYTTSDCMFYKCDGNYIEGVEIITTKLGPDKCTPQDRLDIIIDEIENLLNSSVPITKNAVDDMVSNPGDLLAQVIAKMKEFLNSTDLITVKEIQNIFTKVDDVLSLGGIDVKSNFLHLLDDLGLRIDLNGSGSVYSVKKNIALVVADARPGSRVKGLQVAATGKDTFTNGTFLIITDNNTASMSNATSDMKVFLPDSVSSIKRRVSFIAFRDDSAFQGGQEKFTVNSRVLSINVENLTKFSPGEAVNIGFKPFDFERKRNYNFTCAFWKFNNDIGSWSEEGCNFTSASQEGQLDTCTCDHLTHFAEILVRTGFPDEVEITLERLSVLGCYVSILGLLLVGLTAALFRSWRRDYSNKIWLQLCISILILSICFLIVVHAKFQENNILCILTGVAVHYSVLSSFCWMLVAAIISYRKLVLVFSQDPSHKLLRASAFAWGAPCAVVGVLLSVAPHSYDQYEVKNPSGAFCYPTGLPLWLTVYAPIVLILLANGTLFVLIFRSAFGKRRPSSHKNESTMKEAFRCASVSFLLVFLFGLPWLLGIFSFNVVGAFLFTILVTFQGFVLFFLFVGNKKTRDLWLAKLKIKKATIPGMNSTGADLPLSKVEENRYRKKLSQTPLLPNGSS